MNLKAAGQNTQNTHLFFGVEDGDLKPPFQSVIQNIDDAAILSA